MNFVNFYEDGMVLKNNIENASIFLRLSHLYKKKYDLSSPTSEATVSITMSWVRVSFGCLVVLLIRSQPADT
jgi:hypothetical protein